MTTVFFEFVTSYVEQSQCSCNMDQEDDTVSIDVNGITVHLTEQSHGGFFIAQTGVAVLPDTVPAREAFFREILKANNLFSGTNGFTLGLDESLGLVTLQLYWSMENLTNEKFHNIVNNLLLAASDCITYFNNWSFTAEPEQNNMMDSNMIPC